MATNQEILATIISAISTLKEGENFTSRELANETDYHRDTINNWLEIIKITSELNVNISKTKTTNQMIVSKLKEPREEIKELIAELKKR